MSFWASKSYSASTVDQILDKEYFTLDELLDATEIVQETQALNGALIAYLTKPDTVHQLLNYVLAPQTPEKDAKGNVQASDKAFKMPAMACEVFCCEARSIFDTLLENESLMEQLFAVLDSAEPLDCVMAGYFARVVYCLYTKRIERGRYEQSVEVIEYLQRHPEIIPKLIRHIGSTSIAEVLLRFLGADENSATPIPSAKLTWMLEHSYLEELVEKLAPTASLDAQHNAAYILSGIVRGNFSPLVAHLTQRPAILAKIFEYAFAKPEVPQGEENPLWKSTGPFGTLFTPLPRRRPALDVCIGLLDVVEKDCASLEEEPVTPTAHLKVISAECRSLALKEMRKHMPQMKEILKGEGINLENQTTQTPYGELKPPLSITRLKAVELSSSILLSQDSECCKALWESGIISQLLQLFLEYPFHNLLHRQVFGIVSVILQDAQEEMLRHLLVDCKFVDWLIEAPEQIQLGGTNGQGKTARAGYIGHVTHLANQLVNLPYREIVAECKEKSEKWDEWSNHTLRDRNNAEDTLQWGCGRPQSTTVASISSSEEMDGSIKEILTFRDIDEEAGRVPGNSWYPDFKGDNNEWDDVFPADEGQVLWPDDSRGKATHVIGTRTDLGFRSIDLDEGLKATSSSSSDSDDDTLYKTRNKGGFDTFGDASSEDEDLDFTIVNSGLRDKPPDAGFTDFDDYGGLHGVNNANNPNYWSQASKTLSLVDVSLSDDSPNSIERDDQDSGQNATNQISWDPFSSPNSPSDPTDFGWASFPAEDETKTTDGWGNEKNKQNEGSKELKIDNSTSEKSPESKDKQEPEPSQNISLGKEGAFTSPQKVPDSQKMEDNEFSSFNYWRQPMLQFEDEDD